MLHPINQKSYMIEGVWPHVRDDDWCGEWKALTRRVDVRQAESVAPGPLLPIASASPFAPRPAAKSPMQSGSSFGTSQSGSALAASGRGD